MVVGRVSWVVGVGDSTINNSQLKITNGNSY